MSAPLEIARNLQQVQERITSAAKRTGRDPDEIQLVAVSKTIDAQLVLHALRCGVKALGENRVQEAITKLPLIEAELQLRKCEFHFVGHLQTNKAKEAVRLFDLIHSVDSERLAKEIDYRAAEIGKMQRVLIEINTSGEITKFGIDQEHVGMLINTVQRCQNLRMEGLMTVGPLSGGEDAARRAFGQLRLLRDLFGDAQLLPQLSMGMTQDFEIAIEEGATMVRIGTAIFGSRNG